MRLLWLNEHGDLVWNEFSGGAIPPYAILSHRWGTEEVTYPDLIKDNGRSLAGRRKIVFCGEQARRDSLRYFWVDTCCINKQDVSELTEAINSMFRWYRGAVKCYAYLSDVSTSAEDPRTCQSAWVADFQSSNWFTRGWTLQELLAPSSVIFYSSQYKELGDKKSLARAIREATGIPLQAINGQPLDTYSVAERKAWAANRQTTKEEDSAYCLLGIFSIFMPLIYGEGKKHAFKRLEREINELPTAANTCFTVAFDRNLCFTGRESILASLERKLFGGEQTTKTAIVGLGGIGKTQIALELAYRTRAKYKNCYVFWIPATDMDSLHSAYRDVAQQLCIPGWDEEKADIKRLIQSHLSQDNSRPWLLIFDNADDMDMWIRSPGLTPDINLGSGFLKEFMPRSNQGCIVFTTRDKKTAVKLAGRSFIEVPEMDEEGAMQLLQKSLADSTSLLDEQDAKALLAELTHLPLAIVQAAAYMNENSIGPADYLSLFNEQEEGVIKLLSEEFEDDWRYKSVKNPVATTWLISFEQIRSRDPLAAEYLAFMGCVYRKDIPQWLLPAGTSRKLEVEAMGTLKAYSFISTRGQTEIFDLHRLVHLATRSWLEKENTLFRWSQMAIERLDDLFPVDNDHEHRAKWRALLPHAAYALGEACIAQDDDRRLDLIEKYARCLQSDGRYKEAEESFKEVIESRKLLGKYDASLVMLTSMSWLASTYWNQGRWDEAEQLEVQVMEIRKMKFGADHPDTLDSISNLASTYRDQGRWDEAEQLNVQVIKIRTMKLGADHLDTLNSTSNLALIYWNQGRWDEAEQLNVRVIKVRSTKLGADHPDTLISISNLALVYWNQGRLNEAEQLNVRVMKIRKTKFGADHPDTLISMSNLASIYRDQRRWDKAEQLHIQVIKIRETKLGADHPNILTSMSNLASIYKDQKRWNEAERLNVQVMEIRKIKLGADHPDTLTSMSNLASIYWDQGRWDKAEQLELQVMQIRKSKLGADHPDTLIIMHNLAFTWKEQGRKEAAINLINECVRIRNHKLGADHPDTISSVKALNSWMIEDLDQI